MSDLLHFLTAWSLNLSLFPYNSFKTPGDANVFKVPLDALIPIFDIGVEGQIVTNFRTIDKANE